MRVGAGDRILIVGSTGSGKSTVATAIASTRAWSRVLIFDPKLDEPSIPRDAGGRQLGTIVYGASAALAALRAGAGRILYRPTPDELDDLPSAFERLARFVYLTGGGRGIVLHETADVAPGQGIRRHLSAVFRWGRSMGIPILACSQRPVWIYASARSEPAAIVLFPLIDVDDRDLMAKMIGLRRGADLPPVRAPFGFLYWERATRRLIEHRPFPALPPLVTDIG